jgi:hypothetical protein
VDQKNSMTRVISAESLRQCRLKVTVNDGVSGIFPVEPERRGGVFLKLLDARVFNAVTVNPDFGCVEWPGGLDLCLDTMHQAMTGSAAEVELPSPLALREDTEKNREGNQAGGFFNATCHAEIR